jgi:hypothetical protein
VSSYNFSRSFNSFSLFFPTLDFAVDLVAFAAAFLERLETDEDVEDFFRGLAVSFEVFFVAMKRNVPQLRVDCEEFLRRRQP